MANQTDTLGRSQMNATRNDHQSIRSQTRYQILLPTILAIAVYFFRLGERTLHGDEIWSLKTVHEIATSLQSVSYFFILRLWQQFGGTSESWLRSLSVLFAIASVIATFFGVKRLLGKQVAFITSILLATSPFLIGYAQQVRFYTLFLLAACASMWAFLAYLMQPSRRRAFWWLFATLVVLTTHAMSVLLVFGEAITLFLWHPRPTRWQKIAVLSTITAVAILLLSVDVFRKSTFNILALYTNAVPIYLGPKGISVAQFAKIPLTLFFLTFGEAVYPLFYPLIIPGLLVYGLALTAGLWRLRKQPIILTFVLVTGVSSLVLLFLVFDALAPPTYAEAAPRYLIFLLPLLYFTSTVGSQGKQMVPMVTMMLLINVGSLASYWNRWWSYSDDLINWRAVTQWVGTQMTPNAVVLLDGRAQDMANLYFPPAWHRQLHWPYRTTSEDVGDLTTFQRIIFVSYDFYIERRRQATMLLHKIQRQYHISAVYAQYPLFVYICDQTKRNNRSPVEAQTGTVDIPKEIYGLEFQDVRLPFKATAFGKQIQSSGSFALPLQDGQSTLTIPLATPQRANKLILLSNVTGMGRRTTGSPIATLTIEGEHGEAETFALREGYETSSWENSCEQPTCQKSYGWRKQLALVGAARYPGSWREFDAGIFSTELHFSKPLVLRSLTFERVPSSGVLHVWGIFLET